MLWSHFGNKIVLRGLPKWGGSLQFSLFDLFGNVDFPQEFNLELNFEVFWPRVSCTATDNGDLGAETTGNAFVLGTDTF